MSISGPPILTDYSVGSVVSITEITLQDKDPVFFQLQEDTDDAPSQSPWSILTSFNTSLSYATCAYKCFNFCDHFPHFAQQLYRCVSFWHKYPQHQPVFRTLPIDSKLHQRAVKKIFTSGLLQLLPKIGVLVVPDDKKDKNQRVKAVNDQSVSVRTIRPQQHYQGSPFQTASVDTMISFRDKLVAAVVPPQKEQQDYFCPSIPRIAIINRHEKRHINNVDAIRNELQSEFELPYNIPIYYFEQTSFEEQVLIWSSIDIAITPHGAQETGLIFLTQMWWVC